MPFSIQFPNMSNQALFNTQLLINAEKGDSNAVLFLLKQGANPNACDENRDTALHKAASRGHIFSVKYLLDWKASITFHTISKLSSVSLSAKPGQNTDDEMIISDDEMIIPDEKAIKTLRDAGANKREILKAIEVINNNRIENQHLKICKWRFIEIQKKLNKKN